MSVSEFKVPKIVTAQEVRYFVGILVLKMISVPFMLGIMNELFKAFI